MSVSTAIHDLRFGARMLARNPGVTATVVLTLALGIGSTTAVFSVANSLLLSPLPFAHPEDLMLVWASRPDQGADLLPVSHPNYLDWKQRNDVFEAMGAFFSFAGTAVNLTGTGDPVRLQAAYLSADMLPLLGVRPELGRGFRPSEDQPGQERVALVSHGLWKRRFGGSSDLVGGSLILDGQVHTVVGVMPASFRFPRFPTEADVWLPLGLDPNPGRWRSRGTSFLTIMARLKPGGSAENAQAAMISVAERLATEHPRFNGGLSVRVVPLSKQAASRMRTALLVLGGAVVFVLLIACANVANLILARALARGRELAVRSALGAGRLRIARQLLTESLLLALLGGGAGLALAAWGVDLLALVPYNEAEFFSPYTVPADQIGLDSRVLGFALAISLLTAALFGLVPALQAGRADPASALRKTDAHLTAHAGSRRYRSTLVVCQIALSVILLAGASLLLKSFLRMQSVDPGFDAQGLLAVDVSLDRSRYGQPHLAAA
ncbi:MAG TPA: ABC transporter permease, partial [Candidatus Polarisedimenticolia bacterium]|nr:ABC transporter permease [Candidatus Polarisedimenticolia bacterium]